MASLLKLAICNIGADLAVIVEQSGGFLAALKDHICRIGRSWCVFYSNPFESIYRDTMINNFDVEEVLVEGMG